MFTPFPVHLRPGKVYICRIVVEKADTFHPHDTGHSAKPHGHCAYLRTECDPEAERAAQSAAAGVAHWRRQQPRADSCHDAASVGQYGERSQGNGPCDAKHGSGKGTPSSNQSFLFYFFLCLAFSSSLPHPILPHLVPFPHLHLLGLFFLISPLSLLNTICRMPLFYFARMYFVLACVSKEMNWAYRGEAD